MTVIKKCNNPTRYYLLVFKEDKVNDLLLFKTEFDGYKNIYCTEEFKKLIEDAGLQGLVFSADLASVF